MASKAQVLPRIEGLVGRVIREARKGPEDRFINLTVETLEPMEVVDSEGEVASWRPRYSIQCFKGTSPEAYGTLRNLALGSHVEIGGYLASVYGTSVENGTDQKIRSYKNYYGIIEASEVRVLATIG